MKTMKRIGLSLGLTGVLVGGMIQAAPSAHAATSLTGTVTCVRGEVGPVNIYVDGSEYPRPVTTYPINEGAQQVYYRATLPPSGQRIRVSIQCGWNEWGIPITNSGTTTVSPGYGTAYRNWWCVDGTCYAYR